MSEMIERVAQAICGSPDDSSNILEIHRHRARAAIEAMREPTPEMQRAWCGPYPWDEEAMEIWQAMIDAAMKEKGKI